MAVPSLQPLITGAEGTTEADRVCTTPEESFAWCRHAFEKIINNGIPVDTLKKMFMGRSLTMSGAFEGVSAATTADDIIAGTARQLFFPDNGHPTVHPLKESLVMAPMFAIEINSHARAELMKLPNPPTCIFGDIGQFVPDHLQERFNT